MSHWYRFFPGDYLRDTLHLGWLEDLAYRRLIDLYHARGRPIPNDRQYIMRALRATEPEHQAAVDNVLTDFFDLCTDGWHQKKCDKELSRAEDRSSSAKRAIEQRWDRHRKNKQLTDTDVIQSNYGCITNQNQNQNQNKTNINTSRQSVPLSPVDNSREKVPFTRIVDLYHELLPELPKVVKLTAARQATIRARWNGKDAEDIAEWRSFFNYVRKSKFLMGLTEPGKGHARWRADLEWLCKETNFVKILEGNYHGKS